MLGQRVLNLVKCSFLSSLSLVCKLKTCNSSATFTVMCTPQNHLKSFQNTPIPGPKPENSAPGASAWGPGRSCVSYPPRAPDL